MAYTPKTWVNSDPITASDLNRIETGVDSVDARVTTLESDTGVTTSVGTGQAGWSFQVQQIRKLGSHLACIRIDITRTGGTINSGATGNVSNTNVLQLPSGYIPSIAQILSSGPTGQMASFHIDTSGMLILDSTVPNSDITTGTTLSALGVFMI